MKRFQRRLLYKYYKFSLLWYIFKKDHDWDYAYLLELIDKKLTNLALVIRKEEITAEDKKIAHEIWEARKILRKALYYDYDEECDKNCHLLMLEKFGYSVDFEINVEDHTCVFKYYPIFYQDGYCARIDIIPSDFDKAKEYHNSLFLLSRQKAFVNKKSDLKKFFDYLVEHIWEWAD